jgi:acetyl esterase/lipase
LATKHNLDLGRVVVLGHSAGGHLAMWAAARPRLPKESVRYAADPLPIRAVLNLAGTADMAAYIPLENHACGSAVIEDVMGGKPNQFPERYAQASAIKLLPLGLPQLIVWGHEDDVVPMSLGMSYTRAAKRAGDPVRLMFLPNVGHFEIASPFSTSWPVVRDAIHDLWHGQAVPTTRD